MKIAFFILTVLILTTAVLPQTARRLTTDDRTGSVERFENFPSAFVEPRSVDVWLPPGFSRKKRYAVLYMHDGQMLFDGTTTWNKQEWGIDETMTRLLKEGRIRDTIVVGIWNTTHRREEYMPQKPFEAATPEQKKAAAAFGIGEVVSDRYLKFIVAELKPFIDRTYPTKTGRKYTFLMGSSMGGLISVYAISEYPAVFGGAACLSTHFPAGDGVVIDYLKKNLPSPKHHKIYFDYGTETLDAQYEPYQKRADEEMRQKGYESGKNWITRKFEGADHSETSWSKRVDIPLVFLLGK